MKNSTYYHPNKRAKIVYEVLKSLAENAPDGVVKCKDSELVALCGGIASRTVVVAVNDLIRDNVLIANRDNIKGRRSNSQAEYKLIERELNEFKS
jgi:hypothetical protein